ncbi:hypothetical protein BH11MYX4_BH11MYX4_42440 [soil metagenome]
MAFAFALASVDAAASPQAPKTRAAVAQVSPLLQEVAMTLSISARASAERPARR